MNCSIWFQEDLPFPGVDLLKLRPKNGDAFPNSIKNDIVNNRFFKVFTKIVELNFYFAGDIPIDGRLFENFKI